MKKSNVLCYSLFDFDTKKDSENITSENIKNEIKNDIGCCVFNTQNASKNIVGLISEMNKKYDEIVSQFPKNVEEVVDKTLSDFSTCLENVSWRFYEEIETPLENKINELKQKLKELNKKDKTKTLEKRIIKDDINLLENTLTTLKNNIENMYFSFYDSLSSYFGIPEYNTDNYNEYYRDLHDEFFCLLSEPASMEALWGKTIREIFDIAKETVDSWYKESEDENLSSETNTHNLPT